MNGKRIRRCAAVFMAACVSLVMTVNAFAAQFADTAGHWAEASIGKWSGTGVVKGYEGNFRPDETITRAEFFAILDQVMGYTAEVENTFADIRPADWYYGVMLRLVAAGVVEPYYGQLEPNRPITRQEEAYYLAKAFKLAPIAGSTDFTDDAAIAYWSKGYVKALNEYGYITGYAVDGGFEFRPGSSITRAEAVTMLDMLVQCFINEPGVYNETVLGNAVVNTSGVALTNMIVTGSLYLTEGIADGRVTLDGVAVMGGLIVRAGGLNSIYIIDCDIAEMVVEKQDGLVRIVVQGGTNVQLVVLESGAMIVTYEHDGVIEEIVIAEDILPGQAVELVGDFETLTIDAPGQAVNITGTVGTLIVNADATISGEAVIQTVFVDETVKAAITGDVSVQEAYLVAYGKDGEITKLVSAETGDGTAYVLDGSSTAGGSASTTPPTPPGGQTDGGTTTSKPPLEPEPEEPIEYYPVTGISISESSLTLEIGEEEQLTAQVIPYYASNQGVYWESDNEAVATVSNDGTVKAVGEGTADIYAFASDNNNYKADCAVTVTLPTVTEIEVTTPPTKKEYTVGDKLVLEGLVVTLTYSSGDPVDVAFADFDGAGITAEPANGTVLAIDDVEVVLTYGELTATQEITVNAPIIPTHEPIERKWGKGNGDYIDMDEGGTGGGSFYGDVSSQDNTTIVTLKPDNVIVVPWYDNGNDPANMIGLSIKVPDGFDTLITRKVYYSNNNGNWGTVYDNLLGSGYDGVNWPGEITNGNFGAGGIAWAYPRLNLGRYWKYEYTWSNSNGEWADLTETIIVDISDGGFELEKGPDYVAAAAALSPVTVESSGLSVSYESFSLSEAVPVFRFTIDGTFEIDSEVGEDISDDFGDDRGDDYYLFTSTGQSQTDYNDGLYSVITLDIIAFSAALNISNGTWYVIQKNPAIMKLDYFDKSHNPTIDKNEGTKPTYPSAQGKYHFIVAFTDETVIRVNLYIGDSSTLGGTLAATIEISYHDITWGDPVTP